MKRIITVILFLMPIMIYGQSERKLIREGYRSYMDGEFNEAEVDFRKAEDVNKESFTAKYNTSTALYQQKKIEESAERFEELLAETSDIDDQAMLHYNLGNSYLENNKLKESIESYKKSLRLNPMDEDTRYNLVYALEKLQEQEQQQDQNDKKNQDKNSEDQKQQQDKKDQENTEENQKQQEQNSDKAEEKEQEQNQTAPQQLSKEDAERLLNAILQKEKDVKEKVDKKKAAAAKVKNEKDW